MENFHRGWLVAPSTPSPSPLKGPFEFYSPLDCPSLFIIFYIALNINPITQLMPLGSIFKISQKNQKTSQTISNQKIPQELNINHSQEFFKVKKFKFPPHFQGFSSPSLICYFTTNCGLFLYVYDKTIARRIFPHSIINLLSCFSSTLFS